MTVYLGRRYLLSASHRLFRPEWDEPHNREAFGKCANPHGHGHNYTVEVRVSGTPDPVTGMVADLLAVDAAVAREVLEPFDYCNLNLHPAFRGRVPTSENFCMEIFDRLRGPLPALREVRLEETENNAFRYTGGNPPAGETLR